MKSLFHKEKDKMHDAAILGLILIFAVLTFGLSSLSLWVKQKERCDRNRHGGGHWIMIIVGFVRIEIIAAVVNY